MNAQAVERYLSGEPSTRLAAQFGVHNGTILQWVREAGHEPRGPGGYAEVMTPEIIQQVDRLALQGVSGAEIARQLGVNKTLVYRRMAKLPGVVKHKPVAIPKLCGREVRALQALLQKLEAFRQTDKGREQSAIVGPQIRALRSVLKGQP